MADSIRKLSTDAIMALLAGNADTPMPTALGKVLINKNRRLPIGDKEMPMFSVYFVHNAPKPVGDPRRPMINQNILTIAVRLIVAGNDDDTDPYCQWETAQLGGAERLTDSTGRQITMSITEGETLFEAMEGTDGKVTTVTTNWAIEYKTLPADITRTTK